MCKVAGQSRDTYNSRPEFDNDDDNDDDKGNKYGLFGPWIRVSEGKGLSSPLTGLIFFSLSTVVAGDGASSAKA